MSNQSLFGRSTIDITDFKILNYAFGLTYFVLATPGQIIPSLFDRREEIRFINCPFKEAVNAPIYTRKKGAKLIGEIIDEINTLTEILNEDQDSQAFDNLAITIFNEIKTHDTILAETSGLSQLSVVRLLRLCTILTTIFNRKKIFIVDISNIHPDPEAEITIYKVDQHLIDEINIKGLNNFTGRNPSNLSD